MERMMIMKLSKGLAQAIVDEMMKVIPYNVNVMNEKGVIIGSGDKSRIGSIHEGALEAISSKKLIEIDKPGKNTLPGVNLPIIISDKVIGVVGITGSPQNVKPLSQLVGITASLLINQKKNIEKFKEKEKRLEEFLYELAYRKKQYDDQFIAMAKEYKIDLNKKLYSVIYIVG
jgi:carbohydrate diacid regulator